MLLLFLILVLIELHVALRDREHTFGFKKLFSVNLTGSDQCPSVQKLIQIGWLTDRTKFQVPLELSIGLHGRVEQIHKKT